MCIRDRVKLALLTQACSQFKAKYRIIVLRSYLDTNVLDVDMKFWALWQAKRRSKLSDVFWRWTLSERDAGVKEGKHRWPIMADVGIANRNEEKFHYVYSCDLDANVVLKMWVAIKTVLWISISAFHYKRVFYGNSSRLRLWLSVRIGRLLALGSLLMSIVFLVS